MIAELGWGTKSTDYKKLGKKLKMLHPDKTEQVKTFVHAKQKMLMKKLDEFADRNGDKRKYWKMGDDSFSDLTAHIVGLGREKYYEVTKNPIIAKTVKYKESFLYVFHYC